MIDLKSQGASISGNEFAEMKTRTPGAMEADFVSEGNWQGLSRACVLSKIALKGRHAPKKLAIV